MADIKFSAFVAEADPALVEFVVGYQGAANVKITPTDLIPWPYQWTPQTLIQGSNPGSTGIENTGYGYTSLLNLTTGTRNTAIGEGAGATLTLGDGNIMVGFGADASAAAGTNQIVIGNLVTSHGDNTVVIGNNASTVWEPDIDNQIDLGSTTYSFKDAYIEGVYYDTSGAAGTAGEVLSSTATGTDWVTRIDGTGVVGELPYFSGVNTLTTTNEFTFTPAGSTAGTPTIGIGLAGVANSKGAIEVVSHIDYNGSPFDYFLYTGAGGPFSNYAGVDLFAISIWTSGRYMGSGIHIYSDERIKKDITASNSKEDLETISKIEIANYKFIDEAQGPRMHKKVIGQQVMDVYPMAVSINKDVVPCIYKKSTIENGIIADEITCCDVGDRIKLIYPNGDKEMVNVVESNGKNIKVDSEKSGEVLVYGKEVDDYHSVDYDAIAMLNVSATKELYKIIKELKEEIKELKNKN
tara:strand:+ start:670 stop:2067 length:1398 start_codon:yes stop_codon:yes gene_type:complete